MSDPALPAELRRARIAERVREDGVLRVADAAAFFGVSEVTIRTDLAHLAAAGLVRRVHGSALPVPGGPREEPVEQVSARDAAVKLAIGRRAAALVASGSSLLLDVGSTTHAVARALVDRVERGDLDELVVITNGLSIALSLFLGFYVVCGMAFYWVCSNLLSIVVQVLCNVIVKPRDYIDYEPMSDEGRKAHYALAERAVAAIKRAREARGNR